MKYYRWTSGGMVEFTHHPDLCTVCKRGYSLEDGTLEENYHKYCPYCGGLIQLAQQAQEQQGGEK